MTNGNTNGAFDYPSNGAVRDDALIDCNIAELHYGKLKAVRDVAVKLKKGTITAFIGPSGCGKSTVLRCLNRMNDLVRGFHLKGRIIFRGQDIYASRVDPVAVRRHIGMVFQQPNPFAMSVFRNVAFGLRLNRYKGRVEEEVEQALRQAALWDEVKDKIRSSALALSGGQQQRCVSHAPSRPSRRCC
jgi:phosphate transport system ATP-binding protein